MSKRLAADHGPENPVDAIVVPDEVQPPQPPNLSLNIGHVSFNAAGGLLPPASEMAQYEALQPGSFNRLLRQVEEEGAHRRKRELAETGAAVFIARLSPFIAFAVVVVGLAAAVVVAVYANAAAGAVIGTADLVALTGLFTRLAKRG